MDPTIKANKLKPTFELPKDKLKLYIGVLELASQELPVGEKRSEVMIELNALRKYAKERGWE